MFVAEDEHRADIAPLTPKRIQRACDHCRHKKIRCDGGGKPCTNCATAEVRCTYLEVVKKRGPSKSSELTEETRLKRMEDILDNLQPDGTSCKEGGQIDLHGHPPTRTEVHRPSVKPVADVTNSYESGSSQNTAMDPDDPDWSENAFVKLTESLQRLRTDPNHRRYLGKSSGFAFIQSALELRKEYQDDRSTGTSTATSPVFPRIRPEFWITNPWEEINLPGPHPAVLHFPPDDLLMSLVALYFHNINVVYPLLHEPTFRKSIQEGQHKRHQELGGVVLLVCACASRWSDDRRVLIDWSDSRHSAGWKYLNECTLVSKSLLKPPLLYDLQMLALAALFFSGSSLPYCSWTIVGIGLRIAQDIGVHRSRTSKLQVPTEEPEMWKRAFWVLVSIDREFSSALGRPCAVHDEDFDLDMPLECDDEYWTDDGSTLSFKQPSDKPSILAYFSWSIKLDQILSFAQRTIYSINKSKLFLGFVGPEWEQRIVTQLDSSLNEWIDALPAHLRWDPQRQDDVFFKQSAYLHCNYYRVRILIHRPFIPTPGRQSRLSFPSLTICINASRCIANIIDTLRQRIQGPFLHPVYPCLLSAGIMLLFGIWSGKRARRSLDAANEMEGVHKCLSALKQAEERYYFAGRLVDILCDLASAGDIPLSRFSSERHSKRPREQEDPSSGSQHRSTYANSVPGGEAVDRLHFRTIHSNPTSIAGFPFTTSYKETSHSISHTSAVPLPNHPSDPFSLPLHPDSTTFGTAVPPADMAWTSHSGSSYNPAARIISQPPNLLGTSSDRMVLSQSIPQPTFAPGGTTEALQSYHGMGQHRLVPYDQQEHPMTASDDTFYAWSSMLAEFGLDELGAYVSNTSADSDLIFGSLHSSSTPPD